MSSNLVVHACIFCPKQLLIFPSVVCEKKQQFIKLINCLTHASEQTNRKF